MDEDGQDPRFAAADGPDIPTETGGATGAHADASGTVDTGSRDRTTPLPILPPDTLDRHSTRLYMLAIRHPNLTKLHMIAAGLPEENLDTIIDLLSEQGLLRPVGADTWEAIPPDLALPSLASTYEARATYLRDSAESLAYVYHSTRLPSGEPTQRITVLRNNEELSAAISLVIGTATSEVWAAYDDSPCTAHLFGNDLEWHRARLITPDGTPLRRRTTFDSTMMRHGRAGEVLMARSESGEEHRFLTGVPFSVILADDAIAVIDLTSFDTSGAGSLLIDDRRLVLALRRLAETWWTLGTPMAWEAIGELDRDSAFILSMLAAGATDTTMAVQSGISQRTVERRVRILMSRLGAATRFQAGVMAARRGWI